MGCSARASFGTSVPRCGFAARRILPSVDRCGTWPDRVTRPQPGPIPSAQMTNAARDIPEVRLAELVMPNHTNHHGTLFRGHGPGLLDHADWVGANPSGRQQ